MLRKILITDDAIQNLEAAKQASKQFPNFDFVFTQSANEALVLLPSVDAVISDLFFKEEPINDLKLEYDKYVSQVKSNFLTVKSLYESHIQNQNFTEENLYKNLVILETGTQFSLLQESEPNTDPEVLKKEIEEYCKDFSYEPEFPLGGAIILQAKSAQKAHCLVSNIHCHSKGFEGDRAGAVDAFILLGPLVSSEIITTNQCGSDGRDSLMYIGENEMKIIENPSRSFPFEYLNKTEPKIWINAIERIIKQFEG